MIPALHIFVFSWHGMLLFLQTEHCGWGVEAAESINKEDFIVEYIGEGKLS